MENNTPKVNAALLYGLVADTMPMEGRDFTLTQGVVDGKATVTIKALTDIGRAFAPLLAAKLAKPLEATGVLVAGDGQAVQEALTVRRIREKVEAEAAAARRARIEAAEARVRVARETAEAARKHRIATRGEQSPESPEELAAKQERVKTMRALEHIKRIDMRIPGIRDWVDKQAKAAAAKALETGRSWAVDMDAPLTTPFDRANALANFTEKEQLVLKMAEGAVAQDYLGQRAIEVAKQYIVEKK